MTAWGTIDVAVEAMRRGARDFVEKPWDNHRVLAVIRNQASFSREVRHSRKLEAENQFLRSAGAARMKTSSPNRPSMRSVLGYGGAGRAVRRVRAHHRGKRHRQGPDRPPRPCAVRPCGQAVHLRQHGQHPRDRVRERDDGPRARRLHRRQGRSRRPLRARRRRHAVHGRDRQRAR